MHYRHNTFSRSQLKSTVVPRNRTIPKTKLGSTAKPTDLDFLHLNLLYCGGKESKFMHWLICIGEIYTSGNLVLIPLTFWSGELLINAMYMYILEDSEILKLRI